MSSGRAVHRDPSSAGLGRLLTWIVPGRRAAAPCLCLLLALTAWGCVTPGGSEPPWERVHVVERGDTVWGIARRYGTTVDAVARSNRLRDPSSIHEGDRLRVPERPTTRARGERRRMASVGAGRGWIWPVNGVVSSPFGPRRGSHHDGIDIFAAAGTPVRAARAGVVVHSGDDIPGYGNLVIVKHPDGHSTVYAHNRVNRVRSGERVQAGQVIAEVGATGRASAPHLHFEVRRDGNARDPLDFLP